MRCTVQCSNKPCKHENDETVSGKEVTKKELIEHVQCSNKPCKNKNHKTVSVTKDSYKEKWLCEKCHKKTCYVEVEDKKAAKRVKDALDIKGQMHFMIGGKLILV